MILPFFVPEALFKSVLRSMLCITDSHSLPLFYPMIFWLLHQIHKKDEDLVIEKICSSCLQKRVFKSQILPTSPVPKVMVPQNWSTSFTFIDNPHIFKTYESIWTSNLEQQLCIVWINRKSRNAVTWDVWTSKTQYLFLQDDLSIEWFIVQMIMVWSFGFDQVRFFWCNLILCSKVTRSRKIWYNSLPGPVPTASELLWRVIEWVVPVRMLGIQMILDLYKKSLVGETK